jgi:anti-sigma factor (TIGR02949 family)
MTHAHDHDDLDTQVAHHSVPTGQLAAGAGTDCSEALLRVYEYLDGEMGERDVAKIKTHLDECTACLKQYHLDEALKAVIKRSCANESAPVELRATILQRITMIRYTNE